MYLRAGRRLMLHWIFIPGRPSYPLRLILIVLFHYFLVNMKLLEWDDAMIMRIGAVVWIQYLVSGGAEVSKERLMISSGNFLVAPVPN